MAPMDNLKPFRYGLDGSMSVARSKQWSVGKSHKSVSVGKGFVEYIVTEADSACIGKCRFGKNAYQHGQV